MDKADEKRIKDLLSYDQDTGKIKGRKAWANGNGYLRVTVDYRSYYAHRIAWFLHYGSWPEGDVDHINGDRSDNRIVNLREATRSQNLRNRKTGHGASKYIGVSKNKKSPRKKWVAQIASKGNRKTIGYFHTEEEAAKARDAAALEIHGQFASLNFPEEQHARPHS